MVRKLSIEHVRDGFKKRGLTLLEAEYINAHIPMRYRCDAGHEGQMQWSNVQQGARCAKCARKVKPTIQEIQERFREKKLTLLGMEYVGNKTPMPYQCDAGHEGKISWVSILGGHGCAQCGIEKRRRTIQEVQDGFKKQELILLEKKYVSGSTPMRYRCAAGHEGKILWGVVRGGHGCAQCAGVAKPTIQEVLDGFKERGLTLLETEYVSNGTPMSFRCNAGHEGKMRWNTVQRGGGCLQCTEYGFKPSKPAILYYVRISLNNHPPIYKIGITNGALKCRFRDITKSYQIIQSWNYEIGQDAYDREQEILQKYLTHRIPREIGRKLVESGYTELFYCDVLGLDLRNNVKKVKRQSQKGELRKGVGQLLLW